MVPEYDEFDFAVIVEIVRVGIDSVMLDMHMAPGLHLVIIFIETGTVAEHHHLVLLQLHIAFELGEFMIVLLLKMQDVRVDDLYLFYLLVWPCLFI